jgi:hypothetical protein
MRTCVDTQRAQIQLIEANAVNTDLRAASRQSRQRPGYRCFTPNPEIESLLKLGDG